MRVLVTGVTGQVGSALVPRFATFATAVAADRSQLDLSKPEDLERQLDILSPDVIVNAAAYTAVDRAETDSNLAYCVNATSPGVIARWAARRDVPLIHISTDYVFDGSGERPWREDDATGPLNVYGASKLAGEAAVRASGCCHLIVRTSWVYSTHGTNFLRTMIRKMREAEQLSVVADQMGAPTSAAFIAGGLTEIVRQSADDLPAAFASASNTLHLAAGGTTSWHGFAEDIRRGLERRGVAVATRNIHAISSKDYKTAAARPLNSRLDLSRLAKLFRIEPKDWRALLAVELDQMPSA